LNPMPKNLGAAMKKYRKVLVPEMNLGQLAFILRGTYLTDAISYSKVEGKPFKQSEIEKKVLEVIQ
jgi:2-oxoglutarate/2-oxoacid ferredoxin oxidoreductase subunit alpha